VSEKNQETGSKGPGSARQRPRRSHMKCTRCRGKAEVNLPQHNAAFCRSCYVFYFQRRVEQAVKKQHMFTREDKILVAVSGGKDSLALWDILAEAGYTTTGLHLSLGIGEYSEHSTETTRAFAEARQLPLLRIALAEEGPGLAISSVAAFTNRPPCSACGILKRHYFDRAAIEGQFTVIATGHNLDDEAARLLGNVLHWRTEHLARQHPVLHPTHERFVKKVKPLFRCTEYETAVYAFFRGINYVVEECPNSTGATQLLYKEMLNRLETASPGTKLAFFQEFLLKGRPTFATAPNPPPCTCTQCGMPAYGESCSFCHLVREVETKRERQQAKRAAS